ncbi:MAG: tetratricopeptide repeat protein [Proteobacteria bacterium]|nr:tetratricopeptide repeat protein [Pseudomonadota bacterium]
MTRPGPPLATLGLALALGLPPLGAGAAHAQDGAEQEREYQDCMVLARAAPADGFESALAWASFGGGDGARHCAAVALIGLGHYREAARRLERLAAALRPGEVDLRSSVLAQAGQAWLLAEDTGRAYAVQSAALAIDGDNVELLLDRGITLATAKNYWEAVDDLNRALDLAPGRPDLLVLRANAYRYLDAFELARDDIDRALARDPGNPDGLLERGILRRLAGDEAGARADWLRAIALAEGTPTADGARANLERLDVKIE